MSPRSRKFKEFKRADEDPPPTHVAQPLRALMRWSESSQHTPEAIRDGPRAEATMLYKIRVPVEGSLFLEPGARGCSYSSGASDLSYALAADDTGRVVSATIQAKVPVENIPKFSSIISPGEGDSKAHITIGGDRELYDRMVFEFRRLECNLAFALRGQALQRIDCERMEITFVPETDEERERVGLSGYKVTRGYKETAARIDASGFAQIIRRGSEFAEFDVHKAFLHDGMRHFRALRYVAAFYQFYFVLEDLYSDGKTSEKGVTRAFAHSNELTSILAWSLQTFTKENDRHSRILARFMSAERCDLSVDGLRTFLFRIRGHLHHYSSRSPKPRGTPFNQKDFETVALLGMLVARQAIDRRIAAR